MARVLAFLIGLLTPAAALAWEIDGLRSGMTVAEVTRVMLARGESIDRRVEIGDRKGAYLLSVKSGWLSFCSDVLYSYNRFLPGGFAAFVVNVDREAKRLGAPKLQSVTMKLELIAYWDLGKDLYSLALSKELNSDVFTFSRDHEDTMLEQRCR
jgi:hypothetical protein